MAEISNPRRAGTKFQVTYDTRDLIESGNVTVPPVAESVEYSEEELKETTALVSRLTVNGVFQLPKENRLNDLFPEIRPITMREFLEKYWRN